MPANPSIRSVTRSFLVVVLAGFFVFVTRCAWIYHFGTHLPYWDEWSAELVPIARFGLQDLPPADWLIAPHAEHRVLWQRLLLFALLKLNGQWDSILRQMANALFVGGYAALLAVNLRGQIRGRTGALLFFLPLVLLASPLAYTNMLFAFQTSFHLQFLFSLGALAALTGQSWKSGLWWLGLVAGLAAIFTNGSGFFTGPVLLAWVGISLAKAALADHSSRPPDGRWSRWREAWPKQIPTAIAATLILLVGLKLMVRPEGNKGQMAQSLGEFGIGILRHLAWPSREQLWLGPLLWSPFFALTWHYLRNNPSPAWNKSAGFLIVSGGWILLNLLAMSIMRGANAIGPVPRYEDFHLVGLICNAAALILMATAWLPNTSSTLRLAAKSWAAAWGVLTAMGIIFSLNEAIQTHLPDFKSMGNVQEHNVARFLGAGPNANFDGYYSRFHLPYPDKDSLAEYLRDPDVRALMGGPWGADNTPFQLAEKSGSCTSPALPPGVSPPPGQMHWTSSFAAQGDPKGKFLSAPIKATQPYFRFLYLGMDTGGGLRLNIIPEAGGKKRQIATERQHGTSTWMPVDVAVEPGKSYRLEFLDKSDSGWGAFTLPVNEPAASHAAKVLGQLSPGLSFITAVALLFLTIFGPCSRQDNGSSDEGDVTPQP